MSSPTAGVIGGAVITALAGTAAVGAALAAAPVEAAALGAIAIGGYVVTHLPVDHANHDPRIARMYKVAFTPNKRTKFDKTLSSTLKRTGSKLESSNVRRFISPGDNDPGHESFMSSLLGDHRLGIQGELKRQHTGPHAPPGKRPKLGLADDWMDAAESEGQHYSNVHEPPEAQPPPAKRVKVNQLIDRVKLLKTQHKINPFFSPAVAMSRKSTGIPLSRKVTHRFSTNEGVIQIGTNDLTAHVTMLANAIENPAGFGPSTANAMLFDQLGKIYDKYVVTKASIRCDYFNGTANDLGVICGLSLKDDVNVLATTGHYAELGGTVYKTLTPLEHSTLTMSVNPGKWFGSKAPSSDSRLTVHAGASALAGDANDARPTDELYYHMWACPIAGANATAINVHVYVTIEYEVTWSEPRNLERSVAT